MEFPKELSQRKRWKQIPLKISLEVTSWTEDKLRVKHVKHVKQSSNQTQAKLLLQDTSLNIHLSDPSQWK